MKDVLDFLENEYPEEYLEIKSLMKKGIEKLDLVILKNINKSNEYALKNELDKAISLLQINKQIIEFKERKIENLFYKNLNYEEESKSEIERIDLNDSEIEESQKKESIDDILNFYANKKNIKNNDTFLDFDWTDKKPIYFSLNESTYYISSFKDMLVEIINYFLKNQESEMCDFILNNPQKFSKNEEDLRSPRKINNGYFVYSNLSAIDISKFIRKILIAMNFNMSDFKVKLL